MNNNIDLPFFEFAGAFEVKEWGPNKLFTDLEPVKIDREVIIGFYQELYQDIKHNRIKELLSKMNFKIQLYASSYFQSYDEELKRTEMFLSQLIEKKLQPFEFKHYKPEFIMKDFLISYEDEDGDQNIFFTDSIDDAYTFYPFIIGKIKNKQGLSVIL
ncbi:MAG TPA: hypothetical protein PKD91_02235 [Bacteroidia bacterium]|nr:hypothetical protein [Bacteroidia bacterium]